MPVTKYQQLYGLYVLNRGGSINCRYLELQVISHEKSGHQSVQHSKA